MAPRRGRMARRRGGRTGTGIGIGVGVGHRRVVVDPVVVGRKVRGCKVGRSPMGFVGIRP